MEEGSFHKGGATGSFLIILPHFFCVFPPPAGGGNNTGKLGLGNTNEDWEIHLLKTETFGEKEDNS